MKHIDKVKLKTLCNNIVNNVDLEIYIINKMLIQYSNLKINEIDDDIIFTLRVESGDISKENKFRIGKEDTKVDYEYLIYKKEVEK